MTWRRQPLFADPARIALLREAMRVVRAQRPFRIDAIVVLPDHLHAIWRLPEDDADFSGRWREIKGAVSEAVEAPVNHRGEKAGWQRRFWEHLIRDETDWRVHLDYIHYNPVKHGHAATPAAWRFGSFARAVARGWYPQNCATGPDPEPQGEYLEGMRAMTRERWGE